MENFPAIEKPDFKTKTGIIVLGFTLVGFLGLTDFLTGYELSFSIFYMIPVGLVTWAVGLRAGLVISLAAAVAWLISDMYTHPQYSHFLIPYWNAFVRLCFFLILTYMLAYIRTLLHRERENARTDPLTGAANILAFYERADLEIERARRYSHPLTVAYIDIDNFKALNDTYGHSMGDKLLRLTAAILKTDLRKTDFMARLGGDEFAVLLPETNEAGAEVALERLRAKLLEAVEKNNWPITFSIGAAAFHVLPHSIGEMISEADSLMYEVKKEGKDMIRVKVI